MLEIRKTSRMVRVHHTMFCSTTRFCLTTTKLAGRMIRCRSQNQQENGHVMHGIMEQEEMMVPWR